MGISKEDIGKRIARLRTKRGILTQAELCRQLVIAAQQSFGPSSSDSGSKRGRNLTPQAVSSWEQGEVVPAWENLALLAQVLATSEAEILFGSVRDADDNLVVQEKLYLSRITEEEAALLTAYRAASKEGQRFIVKNAKGVAEELPAPEATIHNFRRKTDPPVR
jgi:transcriptional regulator with XRE-family HTH domain